MDSKQSFTGRTRNKRTRLSVRAADIISTRLITVGGIGTIIAVSMVFVFLLAVVAPLFTSASLKGTGQQPVTWDRDAGPLQLGIDEYRTIVWALLPDGELVISRLDTGEELERHTLVEGQAITAVSSTVGGNDLALGLDDGSVRVGRVRFETTFRETGDVPEELEELPTGDVATLEKGVVQRTPQGQFRLQQAVIDFQDPVPISNHPVQLLDHVAPDVEDNPLASKEYQLAVLNDQQELFVVQLVEKENQFTGETKLEAKAATVALEKREQPPQFLLLSGRGNDILLVWQDGVARRFDSRNREAVALAEELRFCEDAAAITVCEHILGRETVVVGDSSGRASAWFPTRQEDRTSSDGFFLTRVHQLPSRPCPIVSLGSSQRSRTIGLGYEDGRLRLLHVTTNHTILDQEVDRGLPITHVVIAPKDDGLLAVTPKSVWSSGFDPAYPEATMAALFLPVWYEGYPQPETLWQSSFATSAPEMKLGLWPLIFGTLKATLYTMLLGAPLALLAAIYTSEFLTPRNRARIKPAIEMMASLPSVVLGFLAALVFAPYVERFVPATLACFIMLPLTYAAAAFCWQLIPYRLGLRLQPYRFAFMCLILPVGFLLAFAIGPLLERFLFAGNVMLWLDGQMGTGVGAWILLLLPLSGLLTALAVTFTINPLLRGKASDLNRTQFAALNAGKFCAGTLAALLLAGGLSWLLNAMGFDPRGTYVDTYTQRNALVVGFVMGFAVIPIIYTIADDALSTVPNHLRSASLGCGATQWQTAVRVVVPTAMSGLFSALMIGLGRAVGETMIVLMAGGNTPVKDLNIFNGFRTLSANIAVELPEAVRDSTHYRTLFLAALTLFVLTFFVNTVAEVVRLRFRRRAYQL